MPNRIGLAHPLPGLLQGRPRGDAAQLPLHAPRDRPRARGQRRRGDRSPTPSATRTSRRAAAFPGSASGRSPTAARASASATLRGRCSPPTRRPDALRRAGPVGAGGDLLHLGQHRPGEGRHALPRDASRWMIASAREAFELTAEDVFLPGSSMSHIGVVPVGADDALGRRPGRRRPHLRQPRDPAAAARAPADGAGDDPRRPRRADPRPRPAARRLLLAARLPLRLRQGLDRAARREFAAAAGFPIDEGYGMTEVGLATLNPPSGVIKQGSIGPPIAGLQHRDPRRRGRGARPRDRRAGLDPHPQPHGRLLAGAGGDRRDRPRRAGSTRATSPAPTRTATCGSSAARSR